MPFSLPDLPFARAALEPHISARTFDYHHGKHHKAYIDKTNELIAGTPLAAADLVTVVRQATARGDGRLANQAGQAWNHSFFWQCLSPTGGGRPTGRAAEIIDRDFGSFDAFLKQFHAEAIGHFASGWAWLVLRDFRLEITSCHDGESPIIHEGIKPVLTLDVWEHAYYLDYQNGRAAFVDAFLETMVNWDFANLNLDGDGVERANQRAQ
jgi:Fe-Mn family superoxide dismutase